MQEQRTLAHTLVHSLTCSQAYPEPDFIFMYTMGLHIHCSNYHLPCAPATAASASCTGCTHEPGRQAPCWGPAPLPAVHDGTMQCSTAHEKMAHMQCCLQRTEPLTYTPLFPANIWPLHGLSFLLAMRTRHVMQHSITRHNENGL